MMSLLEGPGLWVWYTLVMSIYLIFTLLIVCGPMVLLYAAVHILAKLIARLIGRPPSTPE